MTEQTNNDKVDYAKRVRDKALNTVKMYQPFKQVTLEAMYTYYPHKTMEITKSGTVPLPYIAKKDMSTHEWKLTYQQWKTVLMCYFKHLVRYFVLGYVYKIPYGLGFLSIQKKRINSRQYFFLKKNPVPGYRKTYDHSVDGYKLFLHWDKDKTKNKRISYLRYFNVRLMREILAGIYKACALDRSLLYRFRNSTTYE